MTTARIRIDRPDGQSELKELAYGVYVAGRDEGDLVLGDPSTSGSHARITIDRSGVVITDLGSTNGIYNGSGERLSGAHVMKPNSAVRLGSTYLTLLARSAPGGTMLISEQPVSPCTAPPVEAGSKELHSARPAVMLNAREQKTERTSIAKSTIDLCARCGEVKHASTNYVTEVSGGGGRVGPDIFGNTTGHVDPVRSTTTRHDVVHVGFPDGSEEVIQLSNTNLQVRPGSRVVVVTGGPGKQRYYLAIRNRDTRRTLALDAGIRAVFPMIGPGLLFGMMLVPVLPAVAFFFRSVEVFWIGALVSACVLFPPVTSRREKLRKASVELAARLDQPVP